ncbi:MAG: ribulose-phosphate 3-epimerase [Nakamurella sp.]
MMNEPLIAPSILSADFANLQRDIERAAGADWLHVDVMDNHFVPNLTIGLPVVTAIRKVTDIPLDCHLMIENPDRWAVGYAEAGAYNVTVHAEAVRDPISVARDIKAAGAKAGLSLKPNTRLDDWVGALKSYDTLLIMTVEPGFGGQAFMADMLDKVRSARTLVDTGHLKVIVQVDGGVNAATIEQAAAAGADCFVAGSAVFGATDPAAAIAQLRAQAAAQVTSSGAKGPNSFPVGEDGR